MMRRVMGASCIHGRVGAFYAPQVGEGNQILQDYTSKSVEKIRGHSIQVIDSLVDECDRLLRCRALDLNFGGDTLRLPRVVLAVALENVAKQFGPTEDDHESEMLIEIMRHF
jgi:hypothetical protein